MNDLVKNKILNSIHFDDDRKNMDKVNCYAYALGIDLNEDDICSFAYNPGQMGTFIKYSDNYE